MGNKNKELQVLSECTESLLKIFVSMSKEVEALREMNHFDIPSKVGAEMIVLQLLKREDQIKEFPFSHVLRSSLMESIQMFDELMSLNGNGKGEDLI